MFPLAAGAGRRHSPLGRGRTRRAVRSVAAAPTVARPEGNP